MRWTTLGVLILSGCYDGFETEEGQLRLMPIDVFTEAHGGFYPSNPLLESTEMCVEIDCGSADCTDLDLQGCLEQAVTGVGSLLEGDCIAADDVGQLVWEFNLSSCGATYDGDILVDDRVTFDVVAAAEVSASWTQWPELSLGSGVEIDGEVPNDWIQAPEEPFRVVDGGQLMLPVTLSHPDFDDSVAYGFAQASPGATADLDVDSPVGGYVRVTGREGSEGQITIEAGDQTLTAASVVGVADEVDSIELIVGYVADQENDELRTPLAVRAVTRNAKGEVVYGAPVEWSVKRGELAIEPGGSNLPGLDYASISDSCLSPSERVGDRSAVLRAKYGGVKATVDMEWNVSPSDASDEGFEPDPFCQSGGCGCLSVGGTPSGIVALFAVALIGLRRRRMFDPG